MNLEKSPGSLDIGTSAGIMGSSPEQEMTAQSSIDMSKFLQFDVDLRYVSALPGQTALPGQYVGAYTTADARLGWQVSRQFELSFVGRNLLQPHHPEFGSDPSANGNVQLVGIRRSAYVKLTWTSPR
jgi:iron complex outermembrane receptor protein